MEALRELDADVRWYGRKAQVEGGFDPRWLVSLHHGLGGGPWGRASLPYTSRGRVPFAITGSATLAPTRDGPALINAGASADGLSASGVGISWWPNQVQGSVIGVFRATYASASPPDTNVQLFAVQQFSGGTWALQLVNNAGSLVAGWFNNGTDTRATVSNAGLWASGELVVLGYSWSGKGTTLYCKGLAIANNGTAPSTFDQRGAGLYVGIGNDPQFFGFNHAWGSPILGLTVLDRALDAKDWAWIAANPLSWMFEPGIVAQPWPIVVAGAGSAGMLVIAT